MWNGFSGGWYYNSYLNMYSYLPFAGTMYSPFGYGYYNPATIGYAYNPGGVYWSGAGGAKTGTTASLPLSTIAPTGSTSRPALPRLGVTATASPTLSSATRTIQGGPSSVAILSARNGGGFNSIPTSSAANVSGGTVSNVTAIAAAPAPAAAAPASAPRVSVTRR
jgi:hypothetical protein